MVEVRGGQKERIGAKKWRIRVSLGKDPETGKYLRSPSRIVHGTSKDADAAIAEYRRELQSKLDNSGRELTFAEYARDFYEHREVLGESPLSRKSERMEIAKLVDMFGPLALEEIEPATVKKAYLDASGSQGMSQAMIKRVSKRLKMILEEAVNDGILDRNPAAKIKVAEPKRKSPKALSAEEAERLAALLDGEGPTPLTVAIRLMLFGGLRKGEVLGLDWANVDFEANAVFVCKQFSNDRRRAPILGAGSASTRRPWPSSQDGRPCSRKRWIRACGSSKTTTRLWWPTPSARTRTLPTLTAWSATFASSTVSAPTSRRRGTSTKTATCEPARSAMRASRPTACAIRTRRF